MDENRRNAADDWIHDNMPDPDEYSLEDNEEEEDTQSYLFLSSSAAVVCKPGKGERTAQEFQASLDGGERLRLRKDASLSSPSATSRSFTIAYLRYTASVL